MDNYILDYFYSKNGIPVWILNESGMVEYCSTRELFSENENAVKFLSFFLNDSNEEPQLKRLGEAELYAHFSYGVGAKRRVVVVGPSYPLHPLVYSNKVLSVGYLIKEQSLKAFLLRTEEVTAEEFCRFIIVLCKLTLFKTFDAHQLKSSIREISYQKILDKQLTGMIFDIREEERLTAYAPEMEAEVFACVRRGDIETLRRRYKMPTVRDPNAKKTKNQHLFEVVAMVTLSTRAAVEGGVDPVTAYSLSDLYFKKLSDAVSEREITVLSGQILPHFTELVRQAKGANVSAKTYSPYVIKSVRYIRTHLHYQISLKEVAEQVGVTEKYLSRLFVLNFKEKFSSYVQRERINEAKALLENSERSIIEISNSLAFSSESYFIKIFTKFEGITPRKYLDKVKSLG